MLHVSKQIMKTMILNTNATLKTLFLILSFLSLPSLSKACTDQERETLLSFISSLSPPIQSWPNNTSSNNSDCCKWEGIICNPSNSITQISLPYKTLTGQISPILSNLTSLSLLNLSHNSLSGPLPQDLLSLSTSLTTLDLSFNSLSGPIPLSNTALNIQVLNLSANLLNGSIPVINSTSLISLNVSNNGLTGPIPVSLCTLSPSLISLDISYNKIKGKIPNEIGNCSVLNTFRAGYNKLNGSLPDKLFTITSLEHLYLASNKIEGSLNGYPLSQLINLITLDLGTNKINGFIPGSIGQLKNLQYLLLCTNNLTGMIPTEISNCTSLKQLNLRANGLTGDLQSVNFTKLSSLTQLDLYSNHFTGEIPKTIYTCTDLNALRLTKNNLTGQISSEIRNLKKLSFLSLTSNNITNLTSALKILSGCKNLTALLLSDNFFNEAIPDNNTNWEFGFQNIQVLSLGGGNLTGNIPFWLSNMTKLKVLDLNKNRFTGSIPNWLNKLPFLFYLDLSDNQLSGNIPMEITNLPLLDSDKKITQLDPGYLELPLYKISKNQQYNQLTALPPAIFLSNNLLTGNIPIQIGQLKMLHILNISFNSLTGPIPDPLGNLTNLETLDLSRNNLTGMIPVSLKKLHFLATFSVAFNNLQGPVPIGGQFDTFTNVSYEGNPNLCGRVLMKKCQNNINNINNKNNDLSKKVVIALTLGIFFGIITIILSLSYYYHITSRKNSKKIDSELQLSSFNDSESKVDLVKDSDFLFVKGETDISFSDILTATNNFDQSNIVGCGGFGLVYKAELASGARLAIKRLSGDTWLMDREFKAEVEALSLAIHDNLVPLKGYCIQGNLRLLIYSYMENGSLDDWLHDSNLNQSEPATCQFLDWPTRLRIMQGASRGLLYIHQGCKMQIIHRDIKSSNILLDERFEARVADFGLARLIDPYRTHVTTELVGTLGYIPPEYSHGWVATLRGDVYSFGVVLLEMITGKRPVEVLPSESIEIVQWVREFKSVGRERELLDPGLRRERGDEREILRVLDLACLCVEADPLRRPDMQQLVDWLENLGDLGD